MSEPAQTQAVVCSSWAMLLFYKYTDREQEGLFLR